jgi:glycosyltransferase involved in cell wall biosynthesis
MINYSIIIPHKNSPDLLQRCLASIPEREDIQLIIVDDNSASDKVDFNAFPGLSRKNAEVYFTKEGKGAGYARNVGLRHAKGKWLLFADADDFFTENAFDRLFEYVDSPHDIIYFKVASVYSDTMQPAERGDYTNKHVDNFMNLIKDAEDSLRYKQFTPWGKVIKSEFVEKNGIYFDEVVASNDIMFSLLTGHHASSVDAVDFPVYCVTVNKGSLTNTSGSDILLSRYTVKLRRNQFLRKHCKGKHQSKDILLYLVESSKYGVTTFFMFLKLAIKYRLNPFLGMGRWTKGYLSYRKRLKKNREYIVAEARHDAGTINEK